MVWRTNLVRAVVFELCRTYPEGMKGLSLLGMSGSSSLLTLQLHWRVQ
jgi:hypothetical protein